jgi:hypothetical protein
VFSTVLRRRAHARRRLMEDLVQRIASQSLNLSLARF